MASLTATIGGVTLTLQNMSVAETSDGRPTAAITIYDAPGVLDFQPRQPVVINDSNTGYSFSGVVNDSLKSPMPNGIALTHTVNCIDESDIASKRYYSGPEWQNRQAGDIATELVSTTLAADGITAAYAIDSDKSVTDWQQGTQSNTAAVATATGGALQLAYAGTSVTKSESTTANFSTGTSTNVQATNNTLTLTSHSATMLQGTCVGYNGTDGGGHAISANAALGIWSGSQAISSGDTLSYTVWIASTSPQIMAAVDGTCSDGTTIGGLGSHTIRDQNGLWAQATQDLTGYANDQWYTRTFDLTALAGKTLNLLTLNFAGTTKGQYTAYFYTIQVIHSSSPIINYTPSNTSGLGFILSPSLAQQGYINTQSSAVTAYDPSGVRISTGTGLSAVGCFGPSLITYQASAPTSTLVPAGSSTVASGNTVVYTSTDNATWQPVTSGAAIPSLIVGGGASGLSLYFKEVLSITGPDPTIAPVLSNVTATVQPTYANVNTDWIKTVNTQAGWNAGTLNNLTAQSNNDLTLPSANSRNWDNASISSQTLYTSSGGSQTTVNRNLSLTATAGNDVRARFDFANTFSKLDMSISVQVPPTSCSIGLEFATSSWVNNLNSYAYIVYLTTTACKLSKGANGIAGSEVNLGTFTFATALNVGDWHTLRVQWGQTANGIIVYLDGVQLSISQTDNSYPSGGTPTYVGARFYNGQGSGSATGYVDNFAIVSELGFNVYTSQNLTAFANVGTVQDSRLFWASDSPTGTGIVAQVSINGGVYANATNGAAIPGLTKGYATAGQYINVKFIYNSPDPTLQPVLHAYTVWVTSAYSSSGNRVSVPLALASVGHAGSTSTTWSGAQAANTTIAVDTSTDGINWSNVGTGAVGTGAVAGIGVPSDPVVDQFTSNTSANYISTSLTGGVIATWTWDTANSRLTPSGGTSALLLYASATIGSDVDVACVLDQSDNGGFVWRWTDQNTFYYLSIHDGSSANNPNTIQLFVVSGGVATQIGANTVISFKRSTPHVFHVTMTGPNITVQMDGNLIITTGDGTLTAAGFAGFFNDSTGGGSSAHFYLFRLQYAGQDVTNSTIFSRVRLTSTDPTVTPQVNALAMSVHDGDIQNGALIPLTSYSVLSGNRMTGAQILDDLVKQSGNYWWKVVGTKLNFKQHQATLAPWVLTPQGATLTDIVDSPAPTLDTINDTYRNSQWGTGGKDIIALLPESFVGDGVQHTFNVGFPVDSITSITMGGVLQTFGLSGIVTGQQWYYTQGQTSIVQDASGTPISGVAQELTITYNGQVDIVVNVQSPAEIARVKALDTTTGIIDEGEDMSGLNKQAMITQCAGLLNQFGRVNKTLTATTMRSGLAIGQLLPVFVAPLDIFAGAFLLIDVKLTWYTASTGGGAAVQKPTYALTGVQGPQTLSWQRYISKLGMN